MGNRRTHRYPHGKPFLLVLCDLWIAGLVVLWVLLVPGHWTRAIGLIGAFLVFALVSGKLMRRYERTGQAVPISRSKTGAQFTGGLPRPILALRLAFLTAVAVMVVFGFAPFADSPAKTGIIACVLTLFGIALSYTFLVWHYLNTGRSQETDAESDRRA